MDVNHIDLSNDESDIATVIDLSPKSYSVISISDDEEDDPISELISKIDKGNISADTIKESKKLLLHLDEKLRNEETIEILLAQMKMTQRRINSVNGTCTVNRHNSVPINGFTKPATSFKPATNFKPATSFNIDVAKFNNMNIVNLIQSDPHNVSSTNTSSTAAEKTKSVFRMTHDMSVSLLDQQYQIRKYILKKEFNDSLSSIFQDKSTRGVLVRSDLNLVNTNTNDFMAFVGLDEVVKHLQTCGHKRAYKETVSTPLNCRKCGFDFAPMWTRDRPTKGGFVCELCYSDTFNRAVQTKNHYRKIDLTLKKYQNQERNLDRDYKDLRDNSKKFEIFRKEQENRIIVANITNSKRSIIPLPKPNLASVQQPHATIVTPDTQHTAQHTVTSTNSPLTTPNYINRLIQQKNNSIGIINTNPIVPKSTDEIALMQMFQTLKKTDSPNLEPLTDTETPRERKRRLARIRTQRWRDRQSQETLDRLKQEDRIRTSRNRSNQTAEQINARRSADAKAKERKRFQETSKQRRARRDADARAQRRRRRKKQNVLIRQEDVL